MPEQAVKELKSRKMTIADAAQPWLQGLVVKLVDFGQSAVVT